MYQGDSSDILAGSGEFMFSEKSIRLGFIRKVYAILMCQLTVTLSFIALFLFEENTKRYVQTHREMFYIGLVMTFVILIVLACCPNVRRKSPINFIMLALFTLCESFMLGTIASYYNAQEVMMAVGITTVVALGLTLFAFQTKWDFTALSGIMFVVVIILFCFGIMVAIWPNRVLAIVYSSLGALVFSVYLVIDTQLMIGGKHKYSVSPEEYIFAALNLYLDIVNIFLYILTIIGAARD